MKDAAEQIIRDLLADKASKREQESRLWAMTPAQRIDAMRRGRLTFWQLHHWARHAPHEVPTLNGEWEFLAAHTPEVAERKDDAR